MSDGERGETGKTGDQGIPGPKGDKGEPGDRGPKIVLSGQRALGRTQTLTIFAFIVIAFVLLAYRTETADDRLVRNVIEACEDRNKLSPIIDCENLR